MRFKMTMLLAAVLAIGSIAAGCGGDDDDSGDSSDATEPTASAASDSGISKEEFLAQGNALCTEANAEIDAAFQGVPPEQAAQVVTDSALPALQGLADDLRALGAPSGEEDQVNAILDALDEGNAAAEADPEAAVTEGSASPYEEADTLATEYGLTECAG